MKFKNFIILADSKPTFQQDKDNKNFTETEGKYLKWKCAKHDLSYSKLKVRFLNKPGCLDNSVILGFGQTVLDKFISNETLKNVRGSVYKAKGIKGSVFIPTYHPRNLRNMRFKTENGEVLFSTIWGMDFAKWIRLYENGWTPVKENFNIFPTVEEVVDYVETSIKEHRLEAIDLETAGGQGESVYPVMIGLAHNSTDALCIPIKKQHKKPYWTPGEWTVVNRQIKRIFTECRQMYQNGAYDAKVMLQNKYKVNFKLVEHDTMLLHHTITPAMPHDLGFITSTFGQTPAWKDILKESGYNVMGLTDKLARTYNCRDCVSLHQCLPPMLDEAREMGCSRAYFEEAIPSIPVVIEEELTGIYVDPGKLKEWTRYTVRQMNKSKKTLATLAALPEAFNYNSGDHLRWFLYEQPLSAFKAIEDDDLAYSTAVRQAVRCAKCNVKRWFYIDKLETLDVCPKCGCSEIIELKEFTSKPKKKSDTAVYEKYLHIKELRELRPLYPIKHNKKISRKTGKQLLDKKGRQGLMVSILRHVSELRKYLKPTQRHLDTIEGLMKVYGWLAVYNDYAKAKKFNSTYTKFKFWSDGCIHAHIKLHGTETGRPSSSGPNVKMSAFVKSGELRETLRGNPELSQGYTPGKCRDYLRTTVFLITGKSARYQVLTNLLNPKLVSFLVVI